MESKHFRFLWNDTVSSQTAWTPTMARNTLRNLEETWQVFVKQLGYREPSQDWTTHSGTHYKLNVTSWHGGYFAGGDEGNFAWLNITPEGLRESPPTWVIPHELMHCFQYHNTSGFVSGGWIEGHANYARERWLQHYQAFYPDVSSIDFTQIRCAHQKVGLARYYYNSWLFFQYIDENPDDLADLGEGTIRDIWQQTQEAEYSMMTLERITPTNALKEIVGGFARRGATFDYSTQAQIQDTIAGWGEPFDRAANERWQFTELVRRADKPSWWRVPYEMAPMQGGYAIHELVPAGAGEGRVVTVDLNGLADSARGADWSASFIVVADDGTERYSSLWSDGTNSVTLAADENKLYLSVAGAPAIHYEGGFDEALHPYRSDPGKARFPYEIQVTGATPKQSDNGNTEGLVQHANGGGWVAPTATVAATVYLGPDARVLGYANVSDNVRIEDFAVVSSSAQVSGDAVVSGHAWVRGNAMVADHAKIRDWALVEGGTIGGSARVLEHANIKGGSMADTATAKGTAGTGFGSYGSNAIIDGDYGDFWSGRDIHGGIAFGHMPWEGIPDRFVTPLPSGLYVAYDFASAHDSRILDQYGVTDGFTVGSPAWVASDGTRDGFLMFDGSSQYVNLDHSVADLREFTFTALIKPAGGSTNQAVLWLGGSPTQRLTFTPDDGTGQSKFSIINAGAEQTLTGPALAVGAWTHVAVTLDGSTGVLYINGSPVTTEPISIRADELLAANTATTPQHNYLGRSEGSSMALFQGSLDEVRFYSAAPAAGPGGLDALPGDNEVFLSWNTSPDETVYNVKRSSTDGGPYSPVGTTTDGYFTDTKAVNGTAYYYVVSANNGFFESSDSIQVSAVPAVIPDLPVTANATLPAEGSDDIAHLPTGIAEANTIDGDGANSATNDESTYVSPDRSSKGQTFTTGSQIEGYTLRTFTVQHVDWPGFIPSGTYYDIQTNDTWAIQFGILSGTSKTPIRTATAKFVSTPIAGGGTSGTGMFLTFDLTDAVLPRLQPDTTYYIEISPAAGDPYFELNSDGSGGYAGGNAYRGDSADAVNLASGVNPLSGDFIFHAGLATFGASMSPAESWRMEHFETITNTGDAADGSDPNQNGLTNLAERALGGDPKNFDSEVFPRIDPDSRPIALLFNKAKNATDLELLVQENPGLSPDACTPAAGTLELMGEDDQLQHLRFTRPVAEGDDSLFLRLKIQETSN